MGQESKSCRIFLRLLGSKESRIHALLRSTSHHEYTMVAHDPLTGLPNRLYALEPHIGPDGELLMLPTQDVPPVLAAPPPHVL